MVYRGIEFIVVARPGKNEWRWAISTPKNNRYGHINGARDTAVGAACVAIDRYLRAHFEVVAPSSSKATRL